MADTLLYLTRADLESLGVRMSEVVGVVEAGCRAKGGKDSVMPPKLSLHRPDGAFSQAMAAWLPGLGGLGIKWVSLFPRNAAAGLPLLNGLVVLSDPSDGRPMAVMDAGPITAWRTGASVGVAARFLARPDAGCAGVLGCGTQGRSSVRALACVLPGLRRVRCFDIVPEAAAAFVAELGRDLPEIEFIPCRTAADVTAGAGVVVTAVTMAEEREPCLGAGLLEPGALAVALDYDAAWSDAAMAECARFYCDDRATVLAVRASGGRLGGIPGIIAGDLGDLAMKWAPGRRDPSERLFCMNLGMAVEDVVTAGLALDRARSLGAGTELPL